MSVPKAWDQGRFGLKDSLHLGTSGTILKPTLFLNTEQKWTLLVLGWDSLLWEAMPYYLLWKCFALQSRWELPTCFCFFVCVCGFFFTFSVLGGGSSRNVYYKSIVALVIPSQVPVGGGLSRTTKSCSTRQIALIYISIYSLRPAKKMLVTIYLIK